MTATIAPEHREHMLAMGEIGLRHRRQRRETRASLSEPRQTWASRERLALLLLGDPQPHLASVEVRELLTWCRGIRGEKARRIMLTVGIHGLKTVGTLTDRQRVHLAGVLRHGYHDQLDLTAGAPQR
jgi:ATP-dependent Clp protease adapter protein ClpS